MSGELLLLAAGGATLVALTVAAGVAIAVRVFDRGLGALAPAGRARVALALAALPVVAAVAVVATATAAGLFGADHCLAHGAHHPHLCLAHAHVDWISSVGLVVGLAVARLALTGVDAAGAQLRAVRLRRALDRLGRTVDGVVHLPGSTGITAFTLGLFRPRAYVSEALAEAHRDAVIAHERAHVRGRHPLIRALAELLLAFHVPGTGGPLRRHLTAAQEHEADEHAAAALGDRLRVAEAILAVARLQAPPHPVAFEGAPLAARVESLLRAPPDGAEPSRSTLAALAGLGVVVLALEADRVHHAVETLLGWIAGGH